MASKPPRRKPRERPAGAIVPSDLADPEFQTDEERLRREKFAQAYYARGVLSAAAREAGYAGNNATLARTASRLLQEPNVAERVKEIASDHLKELGITTRGVLAELGRIAFFDIGKCFDTDGNILPAHLIDKDTRRALAGYEVTTKTFGSGDDVIESVEKKIKLANKLDALKQLSQYLGIIKDPDDARRGSMTPEEFMSRLLAAREREMSMRKAIDAKAIEHVA